MKLRNRIVAGIAALTLGSVSLIGCAAVDNSSSNATSTAGTVTVESAAEVLAANQAVHATAEATGQSVLITLSGSTASADSAAVNVDGSTVTITAGGSYTLSGTLAGQLVVDAGDADVRLVLDGVTISNTADAAIAITQAGSAVVELADGSENFLSDTDSYADDADVNAALFSAADLTITGNGSLAVTGNGNDGVASKDGLVIESGTITIDAVDDGVRGKDYLVVSGGTLVVQSGGDGLKADNDEDAGAGYVAISGGSVQIEAAGDGIDATTDLVATGGTLSVGSGGGHTVAPNEEDSSKGLKSGIVTVLEGADMAVDASDDAIHSDGSIRLVDTTLTAASGDDAVHAEAALVIDSGAVEVTSSVEGLEAANIVVNGGSTSVTASDDGVNAAGGSVEEAEQPAGQGRGGGETVGPYSIVVTGGTLVVDSTGDGLDSNGTAAISGGVVVVNGPENDGNGALDVNGTFTVSGGTLVAAGSAGMAVAPSADSAQGWVSATLDSTLPAGAVIQLVDGSEVVATFTTSRAVQNIVVSSAGILTGTEYDVYVGGTASGASTGGLAESGELGSATKVATVIAGEAPAGGMGAPGGGGQPPR